MSMEDVEGQPYNPLVCSRANSLEGGKFIWKVLSVRPTTSLFATVPTHWKEASSSRKYLKNH